MAVVGVKRDTTTPASTRKQASVRCPTPRLPRAFAPPAAAIAASCIGRARAFRPAPRVPAHGLAFAIASERSPTGGRSDRPHVPGAYIRPAMRGADWQFTSPGWKGGPVYGRSLTCAYPPRSLGPTVGQ